MMHWQCPWVCHGHSGYGGGYGPLAGHRKEDVTSKVSNPPFTNLTPRSDIDEKPMLIRWLLVVEMFINEGSWRTPVGQVESEYFFAFWPRETPLFSVINELLQCLNHASWYNQLPIVTTVFNHTLAPFQTSCTWSCEQQGVSATFEREGLLCTPLSVTLNLIE